MASQELISKIQDAGRRHAEQTRRYTIPQLEVEIELRKVTLAQTQELWDGFDPQNSSLLDYNLRILSVTAYDPTSGERIFRDYEHCCEALEGVELWVVNEVASAASDFAGYSASVLNDSGNS